MVLLGPPGAGKGTQAKRLADAFSLEHLSSGDVLRAERASDTPLGRQVARSLDAGMLVPDEIMLEVMLSRVLRPGAAEGVLLDGFPRTLPQARGLDEALEAADGQVDLAVSLEVPDEVIEERITGRRSCPQCGEVYHERFHPPLRPGVCDRDGARLVQRGDDTPEVVRQRLSAFHVQTELLKAYYRERGSLVELDGAEPIEVVWDELERLVRSVKSKAAR
ncbi:MAG: adenylate kinase [Phycisphaerae bacterium]